MNETNHGFMKHNGGLILKKIDEFNYELEVKIKNIHLNTGKTVHGGFLSTIADSGMGTAAHQAAGNKRCVTISLDVKFIRPALEGQVLNGVIKVLKKTSSLVFVECKIYNLESIVTLSSGVWKIL
jgi:uncharacterized protein (TIGR00369 family)|tara:strand:+ start:373 stop:747 length:375 start_codon:yes stop_codon:yes gene_type:complete